MPIVSTKILKIMTLFCITLFFNTNHHNQIIINDIGLPSQAALYSTKTLLIFICSLTLKKFNLYVYSYILLYTLVIQLTIKSIYIFTVAKL